MSGSRRFYLSACRLHVTATNSESDGGGLEHAYNWSRDVPIAPGKWAFPHVTCQSPASLRVAEAAAIAEISVVVIFMQRERSGASLFKEQKYLKAIH